MHAGFGPRVRRRPGTVAMWRGPTSQHGAVSGCAGHERLERRIGFAAPGPGKVAAEEA